MPVSERRSFQLAPNVSISALISKPSQPSQQTSRTTIVFLHYWGGSSDTWSQVNHVVSQTYDTVAIDFRGWGRSTGPLDEAAYSMSHLATDIKSVIQQLGLEEFFLVGLSMGGKVAQLIAGQGDLKGLKGLVLVSPAPPTPLELPPQMRDQQLHAYDNASSAEFVARNVLTASSPPDDIVSLLVSDMLRGNPQARMAWPSYGMAEDIASIVDNIDCPVLVLAAGADQVEPLERVQREVLGSIKGARMEVLEGSGHLSPIDDPSGLAASVARFVSRTN